MHMYQHILSQMHWLVKVQLPWSTSWPKSVPGTMRLYSVRSPGKLLLQWSTFWSWRPNNLDQSRYGEVFLKFLVEPVSLWTSKAYVLQVLVIHHLQVGDARHARCQEPLVVLVQIIVLKEVVEALLLLPHLWVVDHGHDKDFPNEVTLTVQTVCEYIGRSKNLELELEPCIHDVITIWRNK